MSASPDYVARGVWKILFVAMCVIPAVSIPFDMAFGAANGLGRTANLALIFSLLYVLTISRFLDYVRQPRERAFSFASVAFVAYSLYGAATNSVPPILTFPGLFAIYSAIAIGISTYAMEKTGSSILQWSQKWIMIGLIPVITLPFLVSATADTFSPKEWMNNLYGFSNVRALGDYVIVAVLLGAGYLGAKATPAAGNGRQLALFAYLSLMWMVLFWSGSRACLLAALVSMVVVSLATWRLHIRHILLNAASFAVGAAMSVPLFVPHNSYGFFARFETTAAKLAATADQTAGVTASVNALATGRIDIWSWAIEKILERPVLGWGYLPMKEMGDGTPPFAHTHNIVLEYALGFGIPVAAIAIGLVAYFWWKSVTLVRQYPSAVRLSALYLATGLPIASLMSVTLLSPFQLMAFGLSLGALLGIGVRRARECRHEARTADADKTMPADTVFL